MRNLLAALGKIGILGLILCAFALGLAGTVYLSLRSPSVTVPDVTSKTFGDGETALEATGLSIRERAKRYKSDTQPGVILDQFPRSGSVVKQGQTVAVIVSRAAREGEAPPADEIVAGEEKKAETESAAAVANNDNQNRPRRKANTNKNTNANNRNSGGSNSNGGGAQNSNRTPTLNTNRNGGANDNRARNANNRNANGGARNTNGNRRPN